MLSAIVAGAASGFLMASVFVCAGVLILFAIVRDSPSEFRPVLEKFPPSRVAMIMVFLAYPTWGAIGAVIGILYKIAGEQTPGSGLGSPNLVFTIGVVAVTLAMAAPFAVLLRRYLVGIASMAVASMGLFGWFLPVFAA